MATKFLAITFFFSLVVILPVHTHYLVAGGSGPGPHNETDANSTARVPMSRKQAFQYIILLSGSQEPTDPDEKEDLLAPTNVLWMYLVFVYLFTGLAFYLIITETRKIIQIRQEYLGKKSTVTDRTIRLSGIPPELRSEEKIKETIEKLEIGKVERVMLCRDWLELDDLIEKRAGVLRKLEEAWTIHLGSKSRKYGNSRRPQSAGHWEGDGGDEESRLLGHGGDTTTPDQARPTLRIWYGFLGLQSRRVDAIDYYQEKLRKLDEQIKSARRKEYKPKPLAFVTLDSTAACVSLAMQTQIELADTLLANGSSSNYGSRADEALSKTCPFSF